MKFRAIIAAAALLAACSSSPPEELPPPTLPQRAGVDPIIAARAEGVVFRAQGAAPDFLLHIYRNDRIFLAWDNGASQETFAKGEPILPRWHGEIYETANARHTLHVELHRARPCRDERLGNETFPVTVLVTIDGEQRSGCGRDL